MRKIILILMLIFTFIFVGCGGSKNSDSATIVKEKYDSIDNSLNGFSDEVVSEDKITNSSTEKVTGEERKIIKRAEIYIESLEFDKALEMVERNVNSFSGYVETSDVYQGGIINNSKVYRNASFTIRIPKENFQDFLDKTGDIGTVTNKNISGEDISSSYFDKEARLKVLKAQEERYIELISQANNITEVLEVEKYLTEVRSEIESITGYLDKMDGLIDYSTVILSIEEVKEVSIEEPDTLGGKIVKVFKGSINSLKSIGVAIVLGIIAIFPYLIILLIIAYVTYIIRKKVKRNK